MDRTFEQERLDGLLKDINDLKISKKHTNNALLVNVALVLKEAMQSNDIAALKGLLAILSNESISACDLINAVIERQEANLKR